MNNPVGTSLTPEQVAKILSAAYRRNITEEEVTRIARKGNLVSSDGTIHLIRYGAYLAKEVTGHGS